MPILVVIRGNAGSGKSTVAAAVREAYGRGCALVEQDQLRRILLREHDEPGGLAPRLIDAAVRVALDGGYHVVLEGILHGGRYGDMIRALLADHGGSACYLSVSWPETLRRHAGRPLAAEVTAEQMREWYTPDDRLGVPGELIVPESSSAAETVATILTTSGLAAAPALAPCPVTCPRCSP